LYKKMKIINWGQDFLYVREYQLLKEVEFVSNRTSYIVLRGRWCDINVRNVHALSDDSNDTIYEELEQVFYHSPKYYMKSLLGDSVEITNKMQPCNRIYYSTVH